MPINVELPEKLAPLLESDKRYIMVHGGRAGAKSYSIGLILLVWATRYVKNVICTREIQRSLEESAFSLLKNLIDKYHFPFQYTDREIHGPTGSRFIFMGLKGGSKLETITRMKSLEGFDIAWIEEAQGVTKQSLDLLDPTIRNDGSKIIATFNRFLDNDPIFEKYCLRPDNDTEVIKINYDENPFCPSAIKKEAEKLKKKDFDDWDHIYNGNPVKIGNDAIFSPFQITAAINRAADTDGPEIVGADIARFGEDSTVFFKRKGLAIVDFREYNKLSTVEVYKKLADFAGGKDVQINIDDTGVGGGVTDLLTANGFNSVQAINFGGKPNDDTKYSNKISEMWFSLPMVDLSMPDIPRLRNELTTRKYKFDNKQKRMVESKADYKKRGYKSPDYADALLLCYVNPSPFRVRKICV